MRNFVKSALFSALLLLTLTGTEIKAGPVTEWLGSVIALQWFIYSQQVHVATASNVSNDPNGRVDIARNHISSAVKIRDMVRMIGAIFQLP